MKNRDLKTNILGWGLCAIVLAALLFVIIKDRKAESQKTQEIEEQIAREEEAQRQRVKKRERQEVIVADLISNLDYGSYVVWGEDDWGENGDYSLSELFGEEATGRAKAWLLEKFGEDYINWEVSVSSLYVNDMSVANEEMKEILARSGVNTIAVTENFEIPAELLPVNVSLGVSETDEELRFAKQRDVRLGETSIADVKGTLTQGEGEYDEDHPMIGFLRKVKGEPVKVSKGETLKIDSATDYLGSVPILFFYETGDIQNDGEEAEGFVSDLERIVDRYAGEEGTTEDEDDENNEEGEENTEEETDDRKYLVICFAEEDSALDILLEDRFGDHYMRTSISKDRISEDNYSALASRMFDRLERQGCFEDLKWQISAAGEEFVDVLYSDWEDSEEDTENSSEVKTEENSEENSDNSPEGNTGGISEESSENGAAGNTGEIAVENLENSSVGNSEKASE